MSVFNFSASAGGAIGVLVGGVVTQWLGWHWIFLINVPIGIAAWLAARFRLPESEHRTPPALPDGLGAALITIALMLGVYGVVQIPDSGWSNAHVVLSLSLAALVFVAFMVRQRRASNPLVPLRLFRITNMAASNGIAALLIAGLFGFFFLESIALRTQRGFGTLATGLAFLPLDAVVCVLSLVGTATAIERFGSRSVLIAGSAMSAVAMFWFTVAPIDGPYLTSLFLPMLILGVGIGVAFPPLMMTAMQHAPSDDVGVMSGIVNTTCQVGGAFGLAILASVSAAFGLRTSYSLATVSVVAAFVLGLLLIRRSATHDPIQTAPGDV